MNEVLFPFQAEDGAGLGYFDRNLRVRLQTKYWHGRSFVEGVAAVAVRRGLYGYMNPRGRFVIRPRFENAADFSEGRAAVEINGKWGYIDHDGHQLTECVYRIADAYSDGLAAVFDPQKTKYGYLDMDGKFAIDPIFDKAGKFSHGFANVCVGNEWWFIDKLGRPVFDRKFQGASRFSEGLAAVSIGGLVEGGLWVRGGWGFINSAGELVVEPKYYCVNNFSDGLAGFWARGGEKRRKNGLVYTAIHGIGFMRPDGAEVIEPIFLTASRFSEGLAAAKLPGNDTMGYGFIDRTGEYVIPRRFSSANDFSNGLASVSFGDYDGAYYYVDKEGKMVWPPVKKKSPQKAPRMPGGQG